MPRLKLPADQRAPRGRPQVHPWGLWFDGEKHRLIPGADFDCSTESMRRMIYARGKRDELQVRVRTSPDGDLWVQASLSGRRSYDWETWLNGEVHSLASGHDFQAKPESFRSYARSVAREKGLTLTTRILHDRVVIRAHRKES